MRSWLAALVTAVALISGWVAFDVWPRKLRIVPAKALTPVVELSGPEAKVRVPGRVLVADVAAFDDEFFAYLMFSHLRSLVARDGCRAFLTYERQGNAITYLIRLQPQNDLLAAVPYLSELETARVISQFAYRWVTPEVSAHCESQSQILDNAYNLPARRQLEHLSRAEQVAYLRRFIRFKAATDPRLREETGLLHPPGRAEAHRLAEDIVTVADFYSLPLDFFLGIGAMENNYMNVKGDLENAVWKRRAQKGDAILRRGSRGVLVLNDSSGVWQITRETLRYAQRLYLADKRDYSALPERLRPPQHLDLNDVSPEVLTTYAGLLFRDLLDRFHGDVATAVAAYNGGPRRPNARYEAGVRMIARYAREVLEHAAVLHGRSAANMQFLSSP